MKTNKEFPWIRDKENIFRNKKKQQEIQIILQSKSLHLQRRIFSTFCKKTILESRGQSESEEKFLAMKNTFLLNFYFLW